MLLAIALLVHGAPRGLYDHGRPHDGQPAAGAKHFYEEKEVHVP